jgi:hypothetical protein
MGIPLFGAARRFLERVGLVPAYAFVLRKSEKNCRRCCALRRQPEEQQVTEMFDRAKAWIVRITELGLLLIALGIVLQMLFGANVAFFGDIVGNVMRLVTTLGSNGVVGLVAIAIILYLFNRK